MVDTPTDGTVAPSRHPLCRSTTSGATDVSITTPAMRRVVDLHTLLTFVYNSVIVALLASFLIR